MEKPKYSGNIFFVEDDPLIALDIKGILVESGYTVVGHTDTAEMALTSIPEANPDLVLMDVNIRGNMDGIQVAEELNKNHNFPVIFLTALSDEETLSRAKLTRPFGYVVKPFEAVDLVSTIEIAKVRFSDPTTVDQDLTEEQIEDFANVDSKSGITVDQLSAIPIFSKLNSNQKSDLARHSSIKTYKAGDLIIQTENKENGFVVLGGRVGIISTSFAGKDLITTLLGPGDSYGLFFTLKDFSEKLYAKAQAESKILLIPSKVLNNLLNESMEFNNGLVSELTNQLTKNISISQALAFSKVEGRIINALLALLPSFGKKVASGTNAGRLFITRKELADFTGTTPETAIRVTKALERSSLLDLTKPGIIKILDIEALREKSYE